MNRWTWVSKWSRLGGWNTIAMFWPEFGGNGASTGGSTSVNAGLASIVIFWILNVTLESRVLTASASLTAIACPARGNGSMIVVGAGGSSECPPNEMLRSMQTPLSVTVAGGRVPPWVRVSM